RQFLLGLMALVVAEQAERRISEPDAAVRLHYDIVRRIELLAVEAIGEHRDATVILGAGDTPATVLAGNEPAIAITRVAVRVVGGLAIDGRDARFLVPAHDAVVGYVTP